MYLIALFIIWLVIEIYYQSGDFDDDDNDSHDLWMG